MAESVGPDVERRRPAVTRELAAFVHDAPAGVASASARAVVRQAVLDLLGVIVAGAAEQTTLSCLSYARSQASDGPSAVVGAGVRLAPSLAALVNGTAAHALDFDDMGIGVGHVSASILPAVLAVAELTGADGSEVCDAVVVGYEVAHRLTRMYVDTRLGPYAAGYHKPSVYAVFGAAAGAGRLLGLDRHQLAHALGIAASQAGGLKVNFGTMTKPLHAGIANRTGIEAALLAMNGFTASTEALEGRFGWHQVICRGEGDLADVLDGLGSSYAIEEGLIFKRYPCCGATHVAIDAVIHLMEAERLEPADITHVDVTIEGNNLDNVLIYPWASTPLEGKFSLPYTVAAAIVDREVTVRTFTDAAVGRLSAWRGRIRTHAGADMPEDGAEVVMRATDGRVVRRDQRGVRGSVEDPLTWAELADKFRSNVAGALSDADARDVVAIVADLQNASSLHNLTELCLGSASG